MEAINNKTISGQAGASSMLYLVLVFAIPLLGHGSYYQLTFLIVFFYIGLLIFDYRRSYFKYRNICLTFNLIIMLITCAVTYLVSEDVERPIALINVVIAYLASDVTPNLSSTMI